ncbi:MAG: hypothetical protein J5611_03635 [Alphaproteobacteria bacterium]|nr:hypothetical protein [Alphaproteobacteria bacterium]
MKKKIVYISGAEVFGADDVRAAFDEVRATLNLDADTILFGVPIDNLDAKTESVADEQTKPAASIEPEPVKEEPETQNTDSNIVPILSVLGANATVETPEEPVPEPIDDILDDEMPVATTEQTLEELLEKMTPLREDVHLETSDDEPSDSISETKSADDATLENLASEFAKVQDTIPAPKKTSERGKISKLKNILPFKKIKRDDSGLMGDLFGWAGIAANDDDFSMPGFFAGVASKK